MNGSKSLNLYDSVASHKTSNKMLRSSGMNERKTNQSNTEENVVFFKQVLREKE